MVVLDCKKNLLLHQPAPLGFPYLEFTEPSVSGIIGGRILSVFSPPQSPACRRSISEGLGGVRTASNEEMFMSSQALH
ncbi:hypothetical protein RRG08_053265 [Elysia crispata]|uniref:Uncharacterized protein n=1 Tax=Elysia crispata TaxID=231223 RepID=A0AAE1AN79_9GAST|nr:hypothetical protein RRG08_053265 [Elysia crispata]